MLEEKRELNKIFLDESNELTFNVIHEKSLRFTDFLYDLLISYELCDRSPECVRLAGHIVENQLRTEIKKIYLQIQEFLEEY